MNWLSTLLVKPRLLPRLDYSAGIAPDCRTMVVVPTMLTSPEGVDRLVETLEIHYLANRDRAPSLRLADRFPRRTGGDSAGRRSVACSGRGPASRCSTASMRPTGTNTFFLFHRPRRWNAGEGLWMGYERKRGKLTEFNALLRGGPRDCFSEIVGDDRHSARHQVCHHARHRHPAAARCRPPARRHDGPSAEPAAVRSGARGRHRRLRHPAAARRRESAERPALLVRPTVCRRRGHRSLHAGGFRRLSGCLPGRLVHRQRASTMWMPFSGPSHGRFPENTVLSHDLLEACHARSALVSDVEFYEEYPSRYNVDIDRRHRWIRGDWQITQWLLPRVPGTGRPAHRQSAFRLVAVEDLRQSAAQPGPRRPAALAAGQLAAPARTRRPGTAAGPRDHHPSRPVVGAGQRRSASRADLPWSMHLRGVAGAVRPPARPDRSSPWRFCPTTPSSAWMPSAARCCACW